MLPRVSAALAQFIAPISTAGKQSVAAQRGFERFTPPKHGKKQGQQQGQPQQENPPSSGAKIIPIRGQASSAQAAANPPAAIPTGISQALLQLMSLFQEQSATLRRWLGAGAYQRASRQQKKTGRIRKGAILDERAE